MGKFGRRAARIRGGAALLAMALLLAGLAVGCGSGDSASTTTTATDDPVVARAKANVEAAMNYGKRWDGPTTGVEPESGKRIVYIGYDQSSPAVATFGEAVEEAAAAIGWDVTVLDGKGQINDQASALGQAIALKPDGIILGGVDAKTYRSKLKQARDAGIPVVGWHSAAFPGPDEALNLFANLNTDPVAIGRALADYAIADSNGTAQAIIVTDEIFAIAKAKSREMKAQIERCKGCKVLAYAEAPFSALQTRTGPTILSLYQRNAAGGSITPYYLTVADIVYDVGVPALKAASVRSDAVRMLGSDGEPAAYQRIRSGEYQIATVPEPLTLQGWQAVDEMTRAFAREQWSGYTPKVYLVTRDNVDAQGGSEDLFIPENDFAEHYKSIWGVQ